MKYQSSVKWFIQGVLRSIDRGPGLAIGDITEEDFVSEIKNAVGDVYEAIPQEDWKEIVDYICSHRAIFGRQSLGISHKFQPWLAAVGVELLADL